MARTAATKKLTEAKREHELALAELETVRARTAAAMIRDANRPILEHYDRVPDPWRYQDPIDPVRSRRRVTRTLLRDRADGAYYPFYETEVDLAVMRAEGRNLSAFFVRPKTAFESLANYTFGEGAQFEVSDVGGKKNADRSDLAKRAQAVVDGFLDENDFLGDLDREIDQRAREDGEALINLREHDAGIELSLLEPDALVEPANKNQLAAWLGLGGDECWKFGVLRRKGSFRPLGYHVVFDNAGKDWDFIRPSHLEHVKRNSIRSAKRGVSDFFQLGEDIKGEHKLRRNTSDGAAVQAAIAFIREHATGADQSGIEAMVSGNATTSYERPVKGGARTTHVEEMRAGTIKDIPQGMKYHAGPLGSLRSPIYIEVAQYVLRAIGGRWNMPEYLISGDASNANFASTLVAESPFVKSREADQHFYGRVYRNVAWKVLKLEWARGRLGNVDWRDVEAAIEISVHFPEVSSRDKAQLATENETLQRMGVKSRRSIAPDHGLDWEEEQANLAQEPPVPGAAQQQGTLPFPEGLRENCGTGEGGFKSGNECGGESGPGGIDESFGWGGNKTPAAKVMPEAPVISTKSQVARETISLIRSGDLDRDKLVAEIRNGEIDLGDVLGNGRKAEHRFNRYVDKFADDNGDIGGEAMEDFSLRMMREWSPPPEKIADALIDAAKQARPTRESVGVTEAVLVASGLADDPEEARGVLQRLKEAYP